MTLIKVSIGYLVFLISIIKSKTCIWIRVYIEGALILNNQIFQIMLPNLHREYHHF